MARAGLTPESVLGTAIDVIDDEGPHALTLAAVAKRVGVATPSLYKHVGGLPELRLLVGIRVLEQLTDRVTTAVIGHSGAEALRAFMLAYRHYVIEHPHRYAAMPQHVIDNADWQAASERLLGVLYALARGSGVTGADAVHLIRGVRATAHGFATLQAAGAFQLGEDVDESYGGLVDLLATRLP
ncbi:TetR/AcrR family transcriptional regulator [Stackebrandtia soli]|uniref:TetR/AcrR family transcriptional regulator n=1 Tax=Stackebrandtia soli TaxID=1892856 RepID=UPI0039EB30D4